MTRSSSQIDVEKILADIARHVRVTTAPLLAAFWSDAQNPLGSATQWVRREARREVLEVIKTVAHPPLSINGPLLSWSKGGVVPNFGRLSYAVRSRYREPLRPTLVVMASTKTKKLYGGGLPRRPVRARELDHDIGVSETYFYLLTHHPELAVEWVHEDSPEFPRERWAGKKIPDAFLKESNTVIEFAGRYSAKKLRDIHLAFSNEDYLLF